MGYTTPSSHKFTRLTLKKYIIIDMNSSELIFHFEYFSVFLFWLNTNFQAHS